MILTRKSENGFACFFIGDRKQEATDRKMEMTNGSRKLSDR